MTASTNFLDAKVKSPAPRTAEWLNVGANLDARFGGVSAIMSPLLRSIAETGNIRVSLAAFGGPDEDIGAITSQVDRSEKYALRGVKSYLRSGSPALTELIRGSSGVHIHGIWQEHCMLAARRARALGIPYIMSAHGMLDPWALRQKRWKKNLYLWGVEKRNLRSAACLHALTHSEAESYLRLAPGVPVAIIPNGADVPDTAHPSLFYSRFPELRGKQLVLFLARIHPKKGLDILTEAWSRVITRWPDAHLVLAGPDSENTRSPLEQSIQALGISDRVTFTGMLAGAEKWSALAASDLFVLPSYSEGQSVSVLEAMGMARPVLISQQCHVAGVVENDCGWQIQPEANQIEKALDDFFSLPLTGSARMGINGRDLVRRSYAWNAIGRKMSAVYEWVGGGPIPAGVELIQQ